MLGQVHQPQDPRLLSASTSPSSAGCISCSTRRVVCDFGRPRCSRCFAETLACSYEWTLDNAITLFPTTFNMNKEITLSSLHAHSEHGGFGKVYRAPLTNGRSVAVKVLFQKKTEGRVLLLSVREAWTWSKLRHDHIVPLIGLADYSKICDYVLPQICFVSPWMSAGNSMEYLAKNPGTDRRIIMLDVADALCYLHACGPVVIHSDIRGCNILIDIREGLPRACLTDFGLSYIREESSHGGIINSTSTSRAGHPRWLAPERIFPEEYKLSSYSARSEASDVFELCRTYLEILSGKYPYHCVRGDWNVPPMVLKGDHPARPYVERQDLTDEIWAMIIRAWAHVPADRPSAREIHTVLAAELIPELGTSTSLALSSLRKISIPHMMSLVDRRHQYYLAHPASLASILDTLRPQFQALVYDNFIDVEQEILDAITVLSRFMDTSHSSGLLVATFTLMGHIESFLVNRAPRGWRHRYTALYLSLVQTDLRLLSLQRRFEARLPTLVRSHLKSLLVEDEIGKACRDHIIQTGDLHIIIKDFAECTLRPGTDQTIGLVLIDSVTSNATLEAYADTFLEAGLLSVFQTCSDRLSLQSDTRRLWKSLVDRLLYVIEKDDPRWIDLFDQQRALEGFAETLPQSLLSAPPSRNESGVSAYEAFSMRH